MQQYRSQITRQPRAAVRAVPYAAPSRRRRLVFWLAVAAGVALALALAASVSGCSQANRGVLQEPSRSSQPARHRSPNEWDRSVRLAARREKRSLVFGPVAGLRPLPAESFARAEWPTAPGFTSLGEVVHFRLWWYDRQGTGEHDRDYGFRRFEYYRTGIRYGN